MATNKTITPTNVTVQIPAMSDPPDMSVPANAIDKAIDGINTLNSQISSITNLTSSITKSTKYANATIEIRKIGRVCFLEIYIPSTITVAEGDYITEELPGAVGPWINNRFVAVKGNGAFVIGFANAKLQIYTAPPSGTASVYLSASYIANTIE